MALVVEAVSVVEVEANAASITLTEPAGTVEGDLLVAVIGTDAGANPDVLLSNTGWAEILNGATAGRNVDLIVEYVERGASAPDLTWSLVSSQEAVGIMYRISGHDIADPIGASAITDGSSTTPTCPDITTEADNSLVLRPYASDDGSNITEDTGYPASTTGRFRRDTVGAAGCTVGVADHVQASAGAVGTAAWGALTNSREWFAATVEIRAATTPPAPTLHKAAGLI